MEKLETQENVLVEKTEKKKLFRLQGKNFFLTYPKCNLTREVVLSLIQEKLVDLQYALVALESHKDGTPHIHVFASSRIKIRTSNVLYFDLTTFHGNYQAARDSADVIEYIKKSDKTPLSYGEFVSGAKLQGESHKESRRLERLEVNHQIINNPLPELVLNGDVSIYSYVALSKAKQQLKVDTQIIPKYMPKKCIWIYGAPGIGKSRYVRDNFDVIFLKAQNKWWDGYNGETVVLLDDFDRNGLHLSHHLKIWSDQFSFPAEVKGNTIWPVYDSFFITSNYLPRELWIEGMPIEKADHDLVVAINRRFKIMTIEDGCLVDLYN